MESITYYLLAISTVAILAVFLYIAKRYLDLQDRRYRRDVDLKEYELHLMKEDRYTNRERMKYMENEERYLPRMMEEIPYLVSKAVRKELSNFDSNFSSDISALKKHFILANDKEKVEKKREAGKQLIRELSHALNTPLSLIETSTANLDNSKNNVEEYIKIISSSVNMCKSVLASYREITLLAESSSSWNPSSIKKSIDAAVEVYEKKLNKVVALENNLPENIDGFSSNYVISVILLF